MRADRLIATLLLLQRRGQITAGEVAAELEVSPRTARRDLEALGTAGLPVYSMAGRGGGWRLLGGGKTDLSGLSANEAVSLFALVGANGPHHHAETRAALRKLTRALPAPMREVAERAADSIRVEPPGPADRQGPDPDQLTLAAVRESVVHARRAQLSYRGRDSGPSLRTIDPLGLVARGRRWYLIAGTESGQRTFRLDRVESYRVLDEPAQRPVNFDLNDAWSTVSATMDELRWSATAEVSIAVAALDRVRFALGQRLVVSGDEPTADRVPVGPTSPDRLPVERVRAKVRGTSISELVALLAGMHPWCEVHGPASLRFQLAELGAHLVNAHQQQDRSESSPPLVNSGTTRPPGGSPRLQRAH